MTFIYELDPYDVEICRTCKYELPTSRLSKVIVWQTDTTKIIYHAGSRGSKALESLKWPSPLTTLTFWPLSWYATYVWWWHIVIHFGLKGHRSWSQDRIMVSMQKYAIACNEWPWSFVIELRDNVAESKGERSRSRSSTRSTYSITGKFTVGIATRISDLVSKYSTTMTFSCETVKWQGHMPNLKSEGEPHIVLAIGAAYLFK